MTAPRSTAYLRANINMSETYGASGHPAGANVLDGVQQHEHGTGGFVRGYALRKRLQAGHRGVVPTVGGGREEEAYNTTVECAFNA